MILAVKNSEDSLHMSVVSLLMSGTQKSGTPECAFKIGSDGVSGGLEIEQRGYCISASGNNNRGPSLSWGQQTAVLVYKSFASPILGQLMLIATIWRDLFTRTEQKTRGKK